MTATIFGPRGTVLSTKTTTVAYRATADVVVAPSSASGCLSVDAWRNK